MTDPYTASCSACGAQDPHECKGLDGRGLGNLVHAVRAEAATERAVRNILEERQGVTTKVDCPTCGAKAGEPCHRIHDPGRAMLTLHAARKKQEERA